jgi:hypothetical protein
MSCPYTSLQNGKVERIIHSVNNVILTLLIQASLSGRYWVEELHIATYMLNHLSTTAIQAACPHIALFGSAPSYEHLRVFGCTCYPNTAATALHKLSARSTRCVFLGYSVDHKGYRCLDLSTNCLIVSRHVVFDEDSFPLVVSPSLTDLDFLCESGSTVSTIGTRLTTAGTSTPAPRWTAPEIPPDFETPVAPMLAPAVPLGFLPRAATTTAPRTTPTVAPRVAPPAPPVAPRTALTVSPAVTDGPPPHVWSASPIAYVWRPRQPAPTSTTPPPPLSRPFMGGQGVAEPVTPLENPHRMITRARPVSGWCLIVSSSPLRLLHRHRLRSHPPLMLRLPIHIGVRLWRRSTEL